MDGGYSAPVDVMSKMMSAVIIIGLFAAIVVGRLHFPFFTSYGSSRFWRL
jgi:hypothetical protein